MTDQIMSGTSNLLTQPKQKLSTDTGSLRDVKEPTHYSKRAGHEVPGVVAVLCESLGMGGYREGDMPRMRLSVPFAYHPCTSVQKLKKQNKTNTIHFHFNWTTKISQYKMDMRYTSRKIPTIYCKQDSS